ncbi:OLC1v1009236C1 [Oldenlandia corymbosa var. corymbosa]|uniref:OLC1v1009236C1 n=1 Tax=Oldenlandia corymbosa var. corymbosa TaxID=529605 RepID=A0AAV1DNE6_OLDCO|nr:OLC1v1009236C1 [Oldenlandia corymbosa var. corymbosa]
MDSGNSGSLQSSSGDEEYDSRPPAAADSISALMNNNNNNNNKRMRTMVHQQGNNNNPSQINVTNLDPLSNYFDAISRQQQQPPPPPGANHHPPPQNSLLNLDMWSKTLRSHLITSSAENHLHQQMISSPQNIQPFSSNSFPAAATVNPPLAGATENNNNNNNTSGGGGAAEQRAAHVGRNPKKRSRASRRAPTTVLTTDTTNFRAMVQEFTGIPAPPFSSSSPFSRITSSATRFDLFGSSPNNNNNIRDIALDSSQTPLPPYLRRPFPQKVPFLASSASSSMVDLDQTINNNNFNSLPGNLLLSSSLLQQKLPPSGLKVVGGMNNNNILLDQFGQFNGPGSLSGLPGLISSDQTTTTPAASRTNWDANMNGNLNNSGIMNAAATANGKLNFTGNPSNFNGEKGINSDNVAAVGGGGSRGGEGGMMESWVCSSD